MKVVFYLTLLLTLALPSLADDWGSNSKYQKLYDRSSVLTTQGKVTAIHHDARPLAGMERGFSVDIKTTTGEDINVQVGPAWFAGFYKKKWNVDVGDTVEVTGSKVNIAGKTVIIATKCVHRVGNTKSEMTLRSKRGIPVWDFDPEEDTNWK